MGDHYCGTIVRLLLLSKNMARQRRVGQRNSARSSNHELFFFDKNVSTSQADSSTK